MKYIPWRRPSKVVAIVDFLLRIISFGLLIWAWVATWQALEDIEVNSQPLSSSQQFFFNFGVHLSAAPLRFLSCFILFSVVQFWAAIRLWQATSLDTDIDKAFDLTKHWYRVNLTILFLGIILFFWSVNYIIVLAHVSSLGIFLTIVHKYMEELNLILSRRFPI